MVDGMADMSKKDGRCAPPAIRSTHPERPLPRRLDVADKCCNRGVLVTRLDRQDDRQVLLHHSLITARLIIIIAEAISGIVQSPSNERAR
jgi:hypothetical protein